jgi:hypothetical protein
VYEVLPSGIGAVYTGTQVLEESKALNTSFTLSYQSCPVEGEAGAEAPTATSSSTVIVFQVLSPAKYVVPLLVPVAESSVVPTVAEPI